MTVAVMDGRLLFGRDHVGWSLELLLFGEAMDG